MRKKHCKEKHTNEKKAVLEDKRASLENRASFRNEKAPLEK